MLQFIIVLQAISPEVYFPVPQIDLAYTKDPDLCKVDPLSPLRSPLLFPTGHYNLPPAYFIIAGMDPWRDVGLIYEEVLREECGIKTKVDVFPGLPHGFWALFPKAEFSKDHREKSEAGLRWLLENSA